MKKLTAILVLFIFSFFLTNYVNAKNSYLVCKTKILQDEGVPDLFFETVSIVLLLTSVKLYV